MVSTQVNQVGQEEFRKEILHHFSLLRVGSDRYAEELNKNETPLYYKQSYRMVVWTDRRCLWIRMARVFQAVRGQFLAQESRYLLTLGHDITRRVRGG